MVSERAVALVRYKDKDDNTQHDDNSAVIRRANSFDFSEEGYLKRVKTAIGLAKTSAEIYRDLLYNKHGR